MSGKRSNLLEDPPTASASDDDEVETSIGEGEEIAGNSSSEEEDEDASTKIPALKKPEAALAAITEKQLSDSESGSDEETDSDTEPERTNQAAKNPGSSVVKLVIETKDSAVKDQDSKKGKTSEKSAAKRSSSEIDGAAASTDVKRVKRVSGEDEKKTGGGEETKKNYFQRVWTEDDEIAVLQGIIDFKNETGLRPYDDTTAFYQLVKKSISFDVSKAQFMEKLRSLRKKYETNVGKAKKGKEPSFSKPHDRKAYELSKVAMGADGLALESAVKSNGKSRKSSKSKKGESLKLELDSSLGNGKNEDDVTTKEEVPSLGIAELDTSFVRSSLVKSLARFGVDDLAAQQGWSRLASEDKKRFEEQWKGLQASEFEFYSQKSGYIHEVMTKMAEAFRFNP